MISKEMIAAIDDEIAKLQMARSLLSGEGAANGRPAAGENGRKKEAAKPKRVQRMLSPEARERIAAAQRKRWAATKKAAKKTVKQ